MTLTEWKKTARIIKEAYAELEREAVNSNVDIFSNEFESIKAKSRSLILASLGYTDEEYKSISDSMVAATKKNVKKQLAATQQQIDDLKKVQNPTTEDVVRIAHAVAEQYVQPPQIIHHHEIVKEIIIKKPTIVKETVVNDVTNRIEYDPAPLFEEMGKLSERIANIKVTDLIDIEKLKEELKNDFGDNFKENINILDMPDWRKLAMGLQGQIDELAKKPSGGGTPAGNNGDIQFNNSGAFGGDDKLRWNNSAKFLSIGTGALATTTQIESGQSGVGLGTISNTAGSIFVNGVGTQFFNNFKSGDTITVGAQTVTVSLVNSNTNMQMSTAITSAHSGISYNVPTQQGLFIYGNGGLLNIGQVGIGNSASVLDTQNQFGIHGSLVIQNTITRDFQAYANNTGTNAYADIFTNTTYLPTGTSAVEQTFFGYDSQGRIDDASTVDIGAVIGARFSAIGGGSGQIGEVLGGLFEASDGLGINPIVTGGNFAVQGTGTDGVVTAGNFQTFLFSNSVDTSFGEQILLSTFGSTIGTATGIDISTMGDGSSVITGNYQSMYIHIPTGSSGITVNGNVYGIISDLGSGNWGIGTVTPTASLHIQAGTTVAGTAPLKLTSGTNLTTAEAGAVEFTTDNYYATITTGNARKNITLDEGLTSGFVPVATTNGRLTDGGATDTELSYLSGVISPLQGQIDGKQDSGTYVTAVSGTANRITSSGGTTPVINISAAYDATKPTIVGNDRKTGLTAAQALATYTVGASDTSFQVSANILVTAATLHTFTCTLSYTDEGNTPRVLVLNFSTIAGALTPTIANAGGAAPYEGVPLHIRVKASTTIIMATTGTFTTVTYNFEERIIQE